MDISVLAVTAGFHRDPVVKTDFLCQADIFGDLRSRYYNIAFLLSYRTLLSWPPGSRPGRPIQNPPAPVYLQ